MFDEDPLADAGGTLHMRQRKNESGWNYRKHAIRFRSAEH